MFVSTFAVTFVSNIIYYKIPRDVTNTHWSSRRVLVTQKLVKLAFSRQIFWGKKIIKHKISRKSVQKNVDIHDKAKTLFAILRTRLKTLHFATAFICVSLSINND
jgi:hypothetical protein